MENAEFKGKVAVVTGAASGIGLATTRAFLEQGASVVLFDHHGDVLQRVTSELPPHRTLGIAGDVSLEANVAGLMRAAIERFGRVDAMVNNAGISQAGLKPLADVDEEQFDRIIAVNLKGVWLGMKHAIRAMVDTGGGSIVNISSAAGLVGQAGVSIYSATKHGVLGLTKSAALEYGTRGIRINAVCPGSVDTPILQRKAQYTPEAWAERSRALHPAAGRDARPEEIAAAILFLCSRGASNIHGIALPVDGGRTAQ